VLLIELVEIRGFGRLNQRHSVLGFDRLNQRSSPQPAIQPSTSDPALNQRPALTA
jgi:hypothetical protein